MLHWIKKTVKWLFVIGFISMIGVLAYCFHLSGLVEKRFSGRKWQIPSTIYSGTTLFYPGKKIDFNYLPVKLKKLGYREKDQLPQKKGEYYLIEDHLYVYLKKLDIPGNKREGFPVAVEFHETGIRSIKNINTGEAIPLFEFGPEIIMQFFGNNRELRKLVKLDEIPSYLQKAVIAAEDHRYYTHFGVDPTGILRALFTNIKYGTIKQGGSTLTQQLAKNYFLTPERTYKRKLNELFISLVIEIKHDKDEILGMYLNEIYFGQKGSASINGVGEAADFYFGKHVSNLSLSESAIIAGMIKGPNIFSPYGNMKKCLARRSQVLNAMHKNGWINDTELEEARNEKIKTIGYSRYNKTAPYFLDYVSQQLKSLYPKTVLSSMGFSIYTTLDAKVQSAAEKALTNGLARLENLKPELKRENPEDKLQGAVVVIQPRTGNILAMVGGRNYGVSQFNRVTQAKRQSGSCFKPVIAATFLDTLRTSTVLSNEEFSYRIGDKLWTPDNFSPMPQKKMSVRDMLRTSCNRAAVDMVVKGGLDDIVENVKKFNFSTDFKPYPSIALGAFEVIPIELAMAYCTFADDGIQPYPLALKDVVDEKGEILVGKHIDINPVISPSKAYLITSMLETVVNEGTARSLRKRGIDFPVAGKTGTTNNFKDAWFIGYTPDFLALVWVGFDNGDSIYSTGSGAALPIWAELAKSIPGYISENRFTIPPGVIKKRICTESGMIAVSLKCSDTREEVFLVENMPNSQCTIHSNVNIMNRLFNGFKGFFN